MDGNVVRTHGPYLALIGPDCEAMTSLHAANPKTPDVIEKRQADAAERRRMSHRRDHRTEAKVGDLESVQAVDLLQKK